MSDFPISAGNWYIYPTYGATPGQGAGAQPYKGSYHSELQLGSLLQALAGSNFVFSGLAVPASSVSLDLSMPLGVAMISGRMVTVPGSTTVTCAASNTNYIYLKLSKDADGYVIEAKFEVNTSGIAPADSVILATAITSGSAVTSTVDLRPTGLPGGPQNRVAVYNTPGTFTFVPTFTGLHIFTVIGGGGGGGSGLSYLTNVTNYASGGGGGGGATTIGSLLLTAGVPITLVVGTGGQGRGGNGIPGSGFVGTASSVSTLTANPGSGGATAVTTSGGAGGAGGAAQAFTSSSFSFAGQTGRPGENATGTVSHPGGNGGAAGGIAGLAGGIGNTNFNPMVPPTATQPGGGGGGGVGEYNSPIGAGVGNSTTGGDGAPGLVMIVY